MPPTQLKGPPFSFVTPHSGTRPFCGTQRHLGISKCEIWVQAVFPSFTPCFETTVLAYLPTLVLLLLLPVDLTILSKSAARDVSFLPKQKRVSKFAMPQFVLYFTKVPWGWRLKCRQVLTTLLLLLSLAELVVSLPFLQVGTLQTQRSCERHLPHCSRPPVLNLLRFWLDQPSKRSASLAAWFSVWLAEVEAR